MKPVVKILAPYFVCLITLLLIIFYYHIDKYLNGGMFVFLTLLIPIGVMGILGFFIVGAVVIIESRSATSLKIAIQTFLCLALLCYIFLSPYRFSSEGLESEVVIRACYEGTQNQATLKFRRDKSFELHSTGVFLSTWYIGTWTQDHNVLYLKYKTRKSYPLGDTLMIKEGYLQEVNRLSNKENIPMFYLGYCRHLN